MLIKKKKSGERNVLWVVEGNGFGLRFYYIFLWKAKLIKLRHPQIDQTMKLKYCEFKAHFKHYTEGSSSQKRSSKHRNRSPVKMMWLAEIWNVLRTVEIIA